MSTPDWDEIVYVDPEDGLGFTRRDFPAMDFPAGTEVVLRGVDMAIGKVIKPDGSTELAPVEGGALEHVLVSWCVEPEKPRWQHVDQLERIVDEYGGAADEDFDTR